MREKDPMNVMKIAVTAVLWTVLVGTSSQSAPAGPVILGVPDRSNAFASIAATRGFLAIAWAASTPDGVSDVYTAISRDAGRTFSSPTQVNGVAGQVNASGEQPARVALIPRAGRDPRIVVVWTAKAADGTRLLTARSDDGGRSFGTPALVGGTDAPGNRGWESIGVTADGSVAAMWLDHRALAPTMAGSVTGSHHDHLASGQNKMDGVARAQLSQLFFSKLNSAAPPRALAKGVCYCCKTALATDSTGGVYAAWRHVYAGNVRDIAFTKSADGGRTFAPPIRVSNDNWVLDGCPENGPALVVDERKQIHVVWPTLVPGPTADEPTLALFYARSQDGSRFTSRQQIATDGVPRHVQITRGPGATIVVIWDEQSSGSRRVAFARGSGDASGEVRFVRQPIADPAPATHPIIASEGESTIAAWTSGPTGHTMIRVERLEK